MKKYTKRQVLSGIGIALTGLAGCQRTQQTQTPTETRTPEKKAKTETAQIETAQITRNENIESTDRPRVVNVMNKQITIHGFTMGSNGCETKPTVLLIKPEQNETTENSTDRRATNLQLQKRVVVGATAPKESDNQACTMALTPVPYELTLTFTSENFPQTIPLYDRNEQKLYRVQIPTEPSV